VRNLIVLFLIVLVTSCGTIGADRTELRNNKWPRRLPSGLQRTIAVTLRVLPRCMTPKLCLGNVGKNNSRKPGCNC
jgi:hypothetical protein